MLVTTTEPQKATAHRRPSNVDVARPPRRLSDVARPDIERFQRQHTTCKVVLVSAPAGYGKSTVLANWCENDPERPAIWAALGPTDNDPLTLIDHLMAGLGRLEPLDTETLAALTRRSRRVDSQLLETLSRCISERTPLIVAIDDAHLLTNRDCLDVLQHVLDSLPPGSQMVLAGRSDPELRLARLRASGDLAELRADALAFDVSMTATYLTTVGLHACTSDVAALHAATEGWPVGVALATIVTNGPADKPLFDALSGHRHEFADYFLEEVLAGLGEAERSFILDTSVVTRFNTDLANALHGISNADEVIRSLQRTNAFLVPLDGDHRWYRYHHLFQELLIDRLDRAQPGRHHELLVTAATWHTEHGNVSEAFDYAQRSGAMGVAGPLLLEHWSRMVSRGELDTIRVWISRSTDAQIASDPSFSIIAGWVSALLGDARRAEYFVSAAATHPLDAPSPDGASSLASSLANLRSALGSGGVSQMIADGELVYRSELPRRSRWLMGGCRAIGAAQLMRGDTACAITTLNEAIGLADGVATTANAEVIFRGLVAFAHLDRHEYELAESNVNEARRLVVKHRLESTLENVTITAAAATLSFRRDERAEAQASLRTAVELLPLTSALRWLRAMIALHLAELALELGDRTKCTQLCGIARDALATLPDAGDLPARLARVVRRAEPQHPGYDTLTPAERRVLAQLATHRTLADIGKVLYVSRTTVKTHVSSIYLKLGAATRAEAVNHLPYFTETVAAVRCP